MLVCLGSNTGAEVVFVVYSGSSVLGFEVSKVMDGAKMLPVTFSICTLSCLWPGSLWSSISRILGMCFRALKFQESSQQFPSASVVAPGRLSKDR